MKRINPSHSATLKKHLQEHPLNFVDVGAAGGLEPIWDSYVGKFNLRCHGFECSPINFSRLKARDSSMKFYPYAISDVDGELEFNLLGTVGSLDSDRPHYRAYNIVPEKIKVDSKTLKSLKEDGTLPSIDALKLDVEGQELRVLKGASKYLAEEVMYVKSEFVFRPDPFSTFSVIDQYLHENGFILFSFNINKTLVGNLDGGDMLHLKNIHWLLKQNTSNEIKRRQILNLVCVCIVTHYINYAFLCTELAFQAGVLKEDERVELQRFLKGFGFAPHLLGLKVTKPRLSNYFFILAEFFSGLKRHKKGTPKVNDVHENPRLWIKTDHLPGFLRQANEDTYKRLSNFKYDFG